MKVVLEYIHSILANGRSQEKDPDLPNNKVQDSHETSFNAEQQSWPLCGLKPKKSLKTYGKGQKKAPKLGTVNSNRALDLPTEMSKAKGSGNADGNSNDLYVYNEDLILEVEEKFFKEDDEVGDDGADNDKVDSYDKDFCDNELSASKIENKKSRPRLRNRRNQEEMVRDVGKAKRSKSPKERAEKKLEGSYQLASEVVFIFTNFASLSSVFIVVHCFQFR